MRSHGIDCSLIVNTFEKPRHLALVLESIVAQAGVDGRIEVIVADDGSRDETADVVAAFAASARMPVRFTSEPHAGFRLARVRNQGARLAVGDYLLFLDGDCILPRDHVAAYLARRRPGVAHLGYCARLPGSAVVVAVDRDNNGGTVSPVFWSELLLPAIRQPEGHHKSPIAKLDAMTRTWRQYHPGINASETFYVGCDVHRLGPRVSVI